MTRFLWVSKKELEWAEAMQNEGRTRNVTFTTFPENDPAAGDEIQVEIKEI